MGSKRVPEVRFKGFSGEWEGCKLGEIAESFEYGLNASATSYDGRNKYIRITDIDESSNKFKQNDLTSPNTDLSQAEKYLLKKGDILFARTGASVGKTYCYDNRDGKVYYAGFLIRARLKQEYNVDFVFQTTLTSKYNNFVKIASQRSGQPGINAVEFASLTVMLPDKVEQDKIGNFFKQLDETIAFQQQELDTLKQTKQGFLQKMFPKEGESVPEIRFSGFSSKWCEQKLKKVFKDFIVPMRDKPKEFSGTIPWTRIEDIEGRFINGTTSGQYVSEEIIKSMNLKIMPKGSLIVSSSATFGIVAIVTNDLITNQTFIGLVPKDMYDIDYLYVFFKSVNIQKKMKRASAGSTIFYISRKQFEEMIGSFPTLEEQTQIGNFFKQLDETIALHEQELNILKQTKKAFLQKMFV
ncbi:restriction endonuclease subunit S [Bacillus altitudinis]|uniref:restriction endonuclease subunit S n=1 Tax=Bacillus altitudinis TaxID=293387 RepID=UPI000FF8FE05|nr:restriction endonuclease subunit S [Bacillus aerophilus]